MATTRLRITHLQSAPLMEEGEEEGHISILLPSFYQAILCVDE